MKLQDLFTHHGIVGNPFADEDAQTDPVFRDACAASTYHPHWDKIYGDPTNPSTSVVFGEKGAGKTAIRLQIASRIAEHNASRDDGKALVIEYDDFNPFLDRFADRLSARKRRQPAKVLAEWKLWDHMDAILSLGVTPLVDRVLGLSQPSGSAGNNLPEDALKRLDRFQRRDLLLLAACYDNSPTESFESRWFRLRRKLRYMPWQNWGLRAIGLVTKSIIIGAVLLFATDAGERWNAFKSPWLYLFILLGWMPWLIQSSRWAWQARGVSNRLRTVTRDLWPLRRVLMNFNARDINNQPLPNKWRTDDRYELLYKLQGVLRALGYTGIVVLVDRVDEPHLINGSLQSMRDFVWSMLDNKFLKQPGLGMKMLLPIELSEYIQHEDRDFYQRARLDKQNLVPSLEWTGESLFDLASARTQACAADGKSPQLRDLFEAEIDDARLIAAFASLRVPRHLFKFLHRLLVTHCQSHVDTQPSWQVDSALFEAQLAVYRREQSAADHGLAVV